MTQFTAINGRNTPSVVYSAGRKRSTAISTTWVAAAMVPMNRMKARKVRSTVASAGEMPASAPSARRWRRIRLFSGTVSTCTNTTAAPRPIAVETFFETAR